MQRPVLTYFPYVLVGDYDTTLEWEESVQIQEVHTYADWDYFHLVIGMLTEPVTTPGFAPSSINDQPENPQPFQNLTVVAYGGDVSFTAMSRSDWPGPALEATMTAIDSATCKSIARELGVDARFEDVVFCAQVVGPENAAPCEGNNVLCVFR
jgi:hypothetical protein